MCATTARGSGADSSGRTTELPATRMPVPTVAADQPMPPDSSSQKFATSAPIPMTTSANAT